MPEKHERNVPTPAPQDAKGDRERQRTAEAALWRAKYRITKRRLADAIKAVGSLRAKRGTDWKND
jgi:hypothetical protein